MAEQPLVSVIMCCYNAGPYLQDALVSVVNQTYGRLEILIIDDGSTDGSVTRLQHINDPRIRWVRQANTGRAGALNRGLAEIRGEYYAVQDADDVTHPERISRQVTCMLGNPDLAAVFCGHDLILDGRHLAPQFRVKDRAACAADIARFSMPAHDPTAMYRVSLVAGIEYELSLRIGAAYDYILRVGERYPLLVLGECLYSYRVHSESVTKRDPQRREQMVREVLRRACVRRGIDCAARFPTNGSGVDASLIADNNVAANFIESAVDQARAGRRLAAMRTGIDCMRLMPSVGHYHKAWVLALTPLWLHRFLRRSLRTPQ
jgi:glycosyltransferase involved in cell wall biosynthesis